MTAATVVSLRAARPEDCRRVWECRNEPSARAMFFNTDEIPYERHREWFADALSDPDFVVLVVEDETADVVGYVRCEIREGVGDMSVALTPAARGGGRGSRALREASVRLFAERQFRRLRAHVLPGNVASLRAFEHAGFVPHGLTSVAGHLAQELVMERPE